MNKTSYVSGKSGAEQPVFYHPVLNGNGKLPIAVVIGTSEI